MKQFTIAGALAGTAIAAAIAAPAFSQDAGTPMMPDEIIAAAEAAQLGDTVRIAYIDPFTGPFGPVGDQGYKQFRFAADKINATGGLAGHRVEVVGYDNKTDPKELLVQLQKAIDEGARIVTQGNGSSVAHALIDAIDKYNRRNPGDEVLYLNYAAVDPSLTNDACSYWHFRFDANSDMKLAAMTDWIKDQPDIKKIYIIGQDYSHGRAVSETAKAMLAEKRPDIEIVGDELHPIGKVKDFAPYVQKISASGADAVITGNWGTDMTLLIKAAADAGLDVPFLTYYGGGLGAPTAMGDAALGKVKQITEFTENLPASPERVAMFDWFEDTYNIDFYYGRVETMMNMLEMAADEAGSAEVPAIAAALEGMTYDTPYGQVTMRAEDHQLIQPLFLSTFSDGVERDVENTGFGFKTDLEIPAEATVLPTTCEMRRPE